MLKKEEEVGELEEGAPNFDAKKEEEAPIPIEDQEPELAVQGILDDDEEEEAVEEERAPEGEVEEKEKIEARAKKPKSLKPEFFALLRHCFQRSQRGHTCHHGHALVLAS